MRKTAVRGIAFWLALIILIPTVTASDISARGIQASYQLSNYYVSLSNVSSGRMSVIFNVVATHDKMTKIGAQKIVVQRDMGNGTWQTCNTFTGYYGYNRLSYGSSIEIDVIPGQSYRATLTAYALDADGSDTGTVTSGTLRAK